MSYDEIFEKFANLSQARVNLGKAGSGLPTKALLHFRQDFAQAKDAVYAVWDEEKLTKDVSELGLQVIHLHSAATNRAEFLKRPDKGRKLSTDSRFLLEQSNHENEIAIILADGLSASAIQQHACRFLEKFLPLIPDFKKEQIYVVKQGRVALSDEIGSLVKAKIAIILIGERPGLTTPDSMGIYFTFQPQQGKTDEQRNCISNIHTHGLAYEYAAHKLDWLLRESIRLKLSGVHLKDNEIKALDGSKYL
jgi:ethanolamine ammonia-lyase small subunit